MKSEAQQELGDINVENIDGDVFDGGCNAEVLSDGAIGEKAPPPP